MAITFTGVTIIAPATGARRPCNGGAFNVQIRITGNCNAAGGRYAVDVYDEDVLPGGDDKLDTVAGLPLAQGNFNVIENVRLTCDANCHVVGRLARQARPMPKSMPTPVSRRLRRPRRCRAR